jgi:hypothetical protein
MENIAAREAARKTVSSTPTHKRLVGWVLAVTLIATGSLLVAQLLRAPSTVPPSATSISTPPQKTGDPVDTGAQQAGRVVLYEEEPAEPQGKQFVGSAKWHSENVVQPNDVALVANVAVPERRLGMKLLLRRNHDQNLPASHTIEIVFQLPPDFPGQGISNVPGILMKQNEQARGVPLSGSAVMVTPGFFLIGLSDTESDRERNKQLLKERAWFDIPVVYNNNRRAILAVEKGSHGERVFSDVFAAWKQ